MVQSAGGAAGAWCWIVRKSGWGAGTTGTTTACSWCGVQVTANFAGQICGDRLRQRRDREHAYSLALTGTNVASGLFVREMCGPTAGDLDGVGQGA